MLSGKKVFSLIKKFIKYTFCPNSELGVQICTGRRNVPLGELGRDDFEDIRSFVRFNDFVLKLQQDWVRGGSTARADGVRDKAKIQFTNFGEVDIGAPINWAIGNPGRANLSWQLHSMFFLKDLVRAHCETSDASYIKCAIDIIRDWMINNVSENPPSIFSWNDHSAAFRLQSILYLFIHCLKIEDLDFDSIRLLIGLICRHQIVLAETSFYSKGTNHGLDQSYFLFLASVSLTISNRSIDFKNIALERLSYELMAGFSEECVNTENSPEYHDISFSNVLGINRCVKDIEGVDIIDNFDLFADKALHFLACILRPDGCFPPIGDSTIRPPRSAYSELSQYEGYQELQHASSGGQIGAPAGAWHAIFPVAGYMVMRSDPAILKPHERLHMVFKCGFLNHYHRQDDDNSFVLYGFGEEWLTDGGLYTHDHDDMQRAYIRSSFAHNVLIPLGAKVHRGICPAPMPCIESYSVSNGDAWVVGRSSMYDGFSYKRRLGYDGRFGITVEDDLTASCDKEFEYIQCWQIPCDKNVVIDGNSVLVSSIRTGRLMKIVLLNVDDLHLERYDIATKSEFCNRSVGYGVLEPVNVIGARFKRGKKCAVSARVDFL